MSSTISRGIIAAILAGVFALALGGCSTHRDDLDDDTAADTGEGEPLQPPKANVQVNYARPADTLARATVTKYFGAEVIATSPRDSEHNESIVRFNGGVPIWEFKADSGVLSDISAFASRTKHKVKSIEYGTVPAHFSQVIPDEGPPEPLDRGSFYVFEVERASGSTNYQAVKVLADGSLEVYNAQPRAGNSFMLCCNVNSDFPEPVILPEQNPEESGGTPPPPEEQQ